MTATHSELHLMVDKTYMAYNYFSMLKLCKIAAYMEIKCPYGIEGYVNN